MNNMIKPMENIWSRMNDRKIKTNNCMHGILWCHKVKNVPLKGKYPLKRKCIYVWMGVWMPFTALFKSRQSSL